MRRLEATRPTRDRPYSGTSRVTTPYLDREIRPTHIENRFGNGVQTARTIHDRRAQKRQDGVTTFARKLYSATKSLRWSTLVKHNLTVKIRLISRFVAAFIAILSVTNASLSQPSEHRIFFGRHVDR